MDHITIKNFLKIHGKNLGLELVAGQEGLDKKIVSNDVHRPGMVLFGFLGLFTFDRVQVLGNTEMLYLDTLTEKKLRLVLDTVYQFNIPCLVVTDGNDLPPDMVDLSNHRSIPLFKTSFSTTKFSHLFSDYVEDVFAPRTEIHGSMVDVYGMGLVFMGPSGIGKSEIVLDLVERGHRLVADDVVVVSRKVRGILVGTSGKTHRDHMEIRGLGILNVRNMFGVRSVRIQKRIEVIVKLVEWDGSDSYDRIGLEEDWVSILDVEIPQVTVPIFPGKNITVIAEAIALNYQLKLQGHHTAREFNRQLLESMQNKPSGASDVFIRADLE